MLLAQIHWDSLPKFSLAAWELVGATGHFAGAILGCGMGHPGCGLVPASLPGKGLRQISHPSIDPDYFSEVFLYFLPPRYQKSLAHAQQVALHHGFTLKSPSKITWPISGGTSAAAGLGKAILGHAFCEDGHEGLGRAEDAQHFRGSAGGCVLTI